jgi:hypothetical protein
MPNNAKRINIAMLSFKLECALVALNRKFSWSGFIGYPGVCFCLMAVRSATNNWTKDSKPTIPIVKTVM